LESITTWKIGLQIRLPEELQTFLIFLGGLLSTNFCKVGLGALYIMLSKLQPKAYSKD